MKLYHLHKRNSPFGNARRQSCGPRAPSAAAMIVLPNAPAAAPRSQHFQKGFGGSFSEKVVARNVYDPKQKNNLEDCEASSLAWGSLRCTNRACKSTSLKPPIAPAIPPLIATGRAVVEVLACSVERAISNIQNRMAPRYIGAVCIKLEDLARALVVSRLLKIGSACAQAYGASVSI